MISILKKKDASLGTPLSASNNGNCIHLIAMWSEQYKYILEERVERKIGKKKKKNQFESWALN